jgi:hypothetical protein
MQTSQIHRFTQAVLDFDGDASAQRLLIDREGDLAAYYAPFDWVNPQARLVVMGITPGRTQAVNALTRAQAELRAGATAEQALVAAKRAGAFSGPMRSNLVSMLNKVGVNRWLGVECCELLFESRPELWQTSSVLPFPVFRAGENYNGTPKITSTPFLRRMVVDHFVPLARTLPNAMLLPLGPVPATVLNWLVDEGLLPKTRVLPGLLHPSAASNERIQYFLGTSTRSAPSIKTNLPKIMDARQALTMAVAELPR